MLIRRDMVQHAAANTLEVFTFFDRDSRSCMEYSQFRFSHLGDYP